MQVDENVREAVDKLFESAVPNISDVLGITFELLSRDEVVATMPVDGRTHQPFGILHGGSIGSAC